MTADEETSKIFQKRDRVTQGQARATLQIFTFIKYGCIEFIFAFLRI